MIKISTVDVDEKWSITEALNKLQATPQRRNDWLVAFKEGVELEDKVVYDTFGEQNEEDFIARYDLSLLTPRSQPMRCKVSFLDERFLFRIPSSWYLHHKLMFQPNCSFNLRIQCKTFA